MPNALVVEIQPDRLGPLHNLAAREQYLGGRLLFSAPDIIVLQPALYGLLATAEQGSEILAAGLRMRGPGRQHLLPGHGIGLAPDVIGLKAGHGRVGEAEYVPDVHRHETARLEDTNVAVNDVPDQRAPAVKGHVGFIGLADVIWRRPETEIHRVVWNPEQYLPGIPGDYAVELKGRNVPVC